MLSMILDRSDQNAPNQASRFTLHVRGLKEQTLRGEKREEVRATFTVDSPIPYRLKDLLERLRVDDTTKGVGAKGGEVKGEWEGRLTRFISRLEAKAEDRRYGFMFKPPEDALNYDWLSKQVGRLLASGDGEPGIKIVDFSEVPSDVLPVVTGVFARLLYDVQFWMHSSKRTPFVFVRMRTPFRSRRCMHSSGSPRKDASMAYLFWLSASVHLMSVGRFSVSATTF
jgi:hypothetical protein